MPIRNLILSFALILSVAVMAFPSAHAAEEDVHKLVLQISDKDPQKMNTVLNVAANVSRYYSDKGEEVEIEIVAFNRGLHMLRVDTSPVAKRMQSFSKSMTNVKFMACGNTHSAMTKKEGKAPELFTFTEMVPAGVVRIIELDEKGWTVVRP